MSVVVTEHKLSPRIGVGNGATAEFLYIVSGTDDEVEVRQAIVDETEDSYNIALEGEFFIPRADIALEKIGHNLWSVTVTYATQTLTPIDEGEFEFDTGGGIQHVTQSRGTLRKYPSTAPDFGGAVGVTADGVEGADLVVPAFRFSETHRFLDAEVTEEFKLLLRSMTGKVNNAPFRGQQAGEVLFLGAAGRKSGRFGHWEIQFQFLASENEIDLTVGPLTGIDKGGWEYLWVRYEDQEDTENFAIVKRPVAVYIEEMYRSADFAGLGI